jgi:hypothetical protein
MRTVSHIWLTFLVQRLPGLVFGKHLHQNYIAEGK